MQHKQFTSQQIKEGVPLQQTWGKLTKTHFRQEVGDSSKSRQCTRDELNKIKFMMTQRTGLFFDYFL